jgi:hypothetical protein
MHFDTSQLWLLIGGLILTTIGGLGVFSDRFLTFWWMSKSSNPREQGDYHFSRYGRGLGSLILGLGMLAIFAKSAWPSFAPVANVLLSPLELLSPMGWKFAVLIVFVIGVVVYAQNLPKRK